MGVNWRAPHELNAMDMGRRQSTIELVAIDMDGTLLDPSHQLTPAPGRPSRRRGRWACTSC